MLNQPHNPLAALLVGESDEESAWRTDQRPNLRLGLLYAAMLLPLLAVVGRLFWLQSPIRDRYLTQFDKTYEIIESIPAPDGRILGADGRVLAYDDERFQLSVHYRWLEEPPDPDWLRKQAYARLDPQQRRDEFLVAAAEAEVLRLRDDMWRTLAALTGRSADELAESRQSVQRRVERIVKLVNDRREQKVAERDARSRPRIAGETVWERLWSRISNSLTTPPERFDLQPVIVREELDYHAILAHIPFEVVAELEAHPEKYPGTKIDRTTRRIYPAGSLASHVIGHRASISEDQVAARQEELNGVDPLDYRFRDRRGITGLERTYDRHLRGLRGERRIVRNRMGEIIENRVIREPRVGQDLVLTLDLNLQSAAESLLDDALSGSDPAAPAADEAARDPEPAAAPTGGCIIVLDVRTGAVVVCANGPRHNLSLLTDFDPDAWQALLNDPRRPFFPRATQMAVAPGSVFKIVTATALLQNPHFNPDRPVDCIGYLHTPERHRCYIFRHYGVGHGPIELTQALAQSCNVYFFDNSLKIGGAEIADWASRLGFGAPTGIELPGEASGSVPTYAPGRWPQSEVLGLAIGQSRLTATPLQLARLMALVANGGDRVSPQLVQSTGPVTTADADRSRSIRPRPVPELDPHTLARIREGLDRVVNWSGGTGYKTVRIPEVRIAGKTGTAEVGPGRADHAWFAGYVPAEAPRYAFVVVLEHGGSGSKTAGPVAQKLVRAMLSEGLLERRTPVLAN